MADFIHKLSIGLKEINESVYWIELLHDTRYLDDADFEPIHTDAVEILKLLVSIVKISRRTK